MGIQGGLVSGTIKGILSAPQTIQARLSGRNTLVGVITVPVRRGIDYFHGEYEYTPSSEMQTIEIADKMATQDIIINPIPSNYGLITWNGTTITVS